MTEKSRNINSASLLRTIISEAGYRGCLSQAAAKNLDDIAIASPSRPFPSEILDSVEGNLFDALREDCGVAWEKLLAEEWDNCKGFLQSMSMKQMTVYAQPGYMESRVFRFLRNGLLHRLLHKCKHKFDGPNIDDLWVCPFKAWVEYACKIMNVQEKVLLEDIANNAGKVASGSISRGVDSVTIKRWLDGNPIEGIKWPCRKFINDVFQGKPGIAENSGLLELLTGWLVVAVAFQAMPMPIRESAKNQESPEPLPDLEAQEKFAESCDRIRQNKQKKIHQLFQKTPVDYDAIDEEIKNFQQLVDESPYDLQFLPTLYKARLAAFRGQKKDAIKLYKSAFLDAFGRAGPEQVDILQEAFTYSFGVKDKVTMKYYWDKLFVLEYLNGGKRAMTKEDEVEFAGRFAEYFPARPQSR